MRLKQLADFHDPDSLASRMRRKRFDRFRRLLERMPPGARVLDVGGTPEFWAGDELVQQERIRVTLVNLETYNSVNPRVEQVICDARDMSIFSDKTFDVVFSNSVIEHVGSYADQKSMAREVQRVADRYFVQTPNYWFPLEPHFLLPLFQFYPLSLKARLVQRYQLGWMARRPVYREALAEVSQIRLLTSSEMRRLFPTGVLYRERFGGMTKSLVMYGGWS
jgi:hypothetical protein